MPGPILKKCFNCRMFLTEEVINSSQCLKCQKNEAKYGKPGTCEYCKLNAAFHDQKCVWCSHAERKFGSPYTCVNCKLRCAFPRREIDKSESAVLLCRLCILQARHNNQTEVAGVPVPPEKPERSGEGTSSDRRDRHHHSSSQRHKEKSHHRHDDRRHRERESSHRSAQKRRHPDESNNNSRNGASSSSAPPLAPNNENGSGFPPFGERDHGENIVKQQKMEDEIRRLKALVQEKEQAIFDKDKQISTLKAEQYNTEKKHRERVLQLQKEKEDSIRAMENMRNKSKKN